MRCKINADLFGNLFFHLSRLEERLCPKRDEHGRFRSEDSLLGKSGLLHHPVVDEIVGVLIRTVIECCGRTGTMALRKAFWPGGERFAAFLSHDVDHPFKWTPKRIAYETWRSARLLLSAKPVEGVRKLRRMIRSLPKNRDPYWTFGELMAWEEQASMRSSFYFAAKRRIKADPSYSIYDRAVRRIARALAARGWEIGLHGSYDSYNDLHMLKEDKRTFEHAVSRTAGGIRQHFLRFDYDATLGNQELSGFDYDATLGYADHEGFRAGASFPFHPYDFQKEQARHLLEIPLTMMDGTLAQHRGYDEQEATECIKRFLSVARKHRGVFSFLLHQSFLDEEECPYMRRLYRDLLTRIAEEDVYCVPGRELARWWRDREGLRIADWGLGIAAPSRIYARR
ncbi:MAG: polysaccharide deacetylase family protein [Candidatus Latescibacteria bacterium]|nr:polysaccharide deacetylase family protein [Candidatus Latescibacterota bacterium]